MGHSEEKFVFKNDRLSHCVHWLQYPEPMAVYSVGLFLYILYVSAFYELVAR